MILKDLNIIKFAKKIRVECNISSNTNFESSKCYFEFISERSLRIAQSYDPFIIGLLPVAMALGEDIEIRGSMDLQLHSNICDAIALFETWFPRELKKIKILCTDFTQEFVKGERILSFFSGGVDALFNCSYFDHVYKKNPITDLILVRGMDIGLDEDDLWRETHLRLKQTADLLGKNFITVETNLRAFQRNRVIYTHTGFGPMLGGIANLFCSDVNLALIGSYGLFSELAPHASGPLVDRLWTSSRQNVTHFTPRFSRLEKVRFIAAQTPEILENLRVCWKNPELTYNCGVCEKCLRSRMEIRIVGASDLVKSFPGSRIDQDIRLLGDQIPENDVYTYYFWKKIFNLENESKIKIAIKKSLRSYLRRRGIYIGSKFYYYIRNKAKNYLKQSISRLFH